MKKTYIFFITFNAFHNFYINEIIKEKFNEEKYIVTIITTFSTSVKLKYFNVILFKTNILSGLKFIRLLFKIKFLSRNHYVKIIIPHTFHILSNFIYKTLFNSKNIQFDIFYEGLVILRKSNYRVKYRNYVQFLVYNFFSIITFHKLNLKGEELLPNKLKSKANIFLPDAKLKLSYEKVHFVKFKNTNCKISNVFVLFLSPFDNEILINNYVKFIFDNYGNSLKLFVKPHFETNDFKIYNYNKSKIEVLNKNFVAEELVNIYGFSKVFLTDFSSVMINYIMCFGFKKSQVILLNGNIKDDLDSLTLDLKKYYTKIE